jgi:hypothetical protein
MDDTAVVGGGQAGTEFPRRLKSLAGGQAPDPKQQGCQVFAIHVLHGDERHSFSLADVVYAADVGVRDLAGDADFIAEARERGFAGVRVQREKLQSHLLVEDEVEGAIDLAHAASARQPEHAVAAGEDRPGDEASFLHAT